MEKEERLEKEEKEKEGKKGKRKKEFFVQVDKRGNFVSSVWVSNLPIPRYLWVFLEFLFFFCFRFSLFSGPRIVSGFDRK